MTKNKANSPFLSENEEEIKKDVIVNEEQDDKKQNQA